MASTTTAHQQVALSMAAGTGYTITFSPVVGTVTVLAEAECYVSTTGNGVTPTAPTSSAIPSSGAQTAYVHLVAGRAYTFGTDPSYAMGTLSPQDMIGGLQIWAVASTGTGILNVVAH